MITEVRDFFKVEVNVSIPTVNLENVEIDFNKMILYREDDDSTIIIEHRKVIFEPVRTSEGFKVIIFILNEGEEFDERIDYMIDEDYEIENIDISIKNVSKGTEYEYYINYNIGEQVHKEVEIEVALPLKNAISYIASSLDKNLENHVYETINGNYELIELINNISNIDIL